MPACQVLITTAVAMTACSHELLLHLCFVFQSLHVYRRSQVYCSIQDVYDILPPGYVVPAGPLRRHLPESAS